MNSYELQGGQPVIVLLYLVLIVATVGNAEAVVSAPLYPIPKVKFESRLIPDAPGEPTTTPPLLTTVLRQGFKATSNGLIAIAIIFNLSFIIYLVVPKLLGL